MRRGPRFLLLQNDYLLSVFFGCFLFLLLCFGCGLPGLVFPCWVCFGCFLVRCLFGSGIFVDFLPTLGCYSLPLGPCWLIIAGAVVSHCGFSHL